MTDVPCTLYDPRFEHDACGTGFVARASGEPGHDIVEKALEAVANLEHRGAVAGDGKSGDGSGVLTQLPRRLLAREFERLGLRLADDALTGLGMFFFKPGDERGRATVEEALRGQALQPLGWRPVPVDPEALGEKARQTMPEIAQVLVAAAPGMGRSTFEQALYRARRGIEHAVAGDGPDRLYIASLSSRTVVYKGLFAARQLASFYPDLRDPDFETALAVYHQRYSTNTFPTWRLAQPFHFLAHNGEINTLWGNRNWMRAREAKLPSELRGVCAEDGSDSASLDEALALLTHGGRDLLHALMMLVPEAWEGHADMDPEVRAFYEYHACLSEPWDGPAALAFTDGRFVGAQSDRNGLRPCRWTVTEEGLVVAGSEVGVIDLSGYHVVEKGRLGPGQMVAVDTEQGSVLRDSEMKRLVASRQPYRAWVDGNLLRLGQASGSAIGAASDEGATDEPAAGCGEPSGEQLGHLQRVFGYTYEDVRIVIRPMAREGADPIWSMGDDTPIFPLARARRSFYALFRQRFAQVTNPPIDPLREDLVMSLRTWLGPRGSLLDESPEQALLLEIDSPVLLAGEMEAIRARPEPQLRSVTLDAVFDAASGHAALETALDGLCREAEEAARDGASIIILSDRGITHGRAPMPMLLAVGAVHHHLIRIGLRLDADIVAEAGDCLDVHHLACLIGYGAAAVHPWLALATAGEQAGQPGAEGAARARLSFKYALEKGLLKVMSKMGISSVSSYRGAQIFEVLGLSHQVIGRAFAGTPSRLGGMGLERIAQAWIERHQEAFDGTAARLADPGLARYRREGEHHAWEPGVVKALHAALDGDEAAYRRFVEANSSRPPATLRDLLEIRSDRQPIDLDEVEPVETILPRFVSTGMSLGALSPEAHRTLAIAMNRIGARSNSGEGGEDPATYEPLPNGDRADNKIKQVASARFGVTSEYVARAEELEIKMAQGSKPGEGGQLPAHKVTPTIARLRHAVPGFSLISPPPHHDIYSIEDLAQLIYDLKRANPRARVGVKLVAEAGVGTVAAGVAKAYADYVLISGHDGGTGASPLSSIKHAGCPWELGLAEAQQTLVLNGLRRRVSLRTDGGLKTARDVVVAALIGADEFGFGTAAVVAMGCDMARQCHLNTCPTGIATQREELRAKFTGTPEMVIHYFTHLAGELREALAALGYRSLEELVGRVDLLRVRDDLEARSSSRDLDLSAIVADVDPSGTLLRRRVQPRNDRPEARQPLDESILSMAEDALAGRAPYSGRFAITNADRSVGARVGGEIGHRYGAQGLPDYQLELSFEGSAGQSFGAFCSPGMCLRLEGQANDYVGKAMSGGEIVVVPAEDAREEPNRHVIMGNAVLYGATAGRLFAAGKAGERFAVRNSGAVAVVEGVGDHGCEYMTGGVVVVLGQTGRNFAAGMTNGAAYVLDEEGTFPARYNPGLVSIQRVTDDDDREVVRRLVYEHYERTDSRHAASILEDWTSAIEAMWKVVPQAPAPLPEPQRTASGESLDKASEEGRQLQPA